MNTYRKLSHKVLHKDSSKAIFIPRSGYAVDHIFAIITLLLIAYFGNSLLFLIIAVILIVPLFTYSEWELNSSNSTLIIRRKVFNGSLLTKNIDYKNIDEVIFKPSKIFRFSFFWKGLNDYDLKLRYEGKLKTIRKNSDYNKLMPIFEVIKEYLSIHTKYITKV